MSYLEIQLEMCKSKFGELHKETAASYGALGLHLFKEGEYNRGLQFQEQCLNLFLQLSEREDNLSEDLANAYANLGLCYFEVEELRQKGLLYQQKALQIRRDIWGDNNLRIANTYATLGMEYLKTGDDEKAIEYMENALTIFNDLNHKRASSMYIALSICYRDNGNLEKAADYAIKAALLLGKVK